MWLVPLSSWTISRTWVTIWHSRVVCPSTWRDVLIPPEKDELVQKGYDEVEQIMANYNMGFITNNERYNQIIDTWTHVNSNLSNILMKQLTADNDGFNSIYMMMDSGARGSKEQIRQLSGMRGLMAKPQKSRCRRWSDYREPDPF